MYFPCLSSSLCGSGRCDIERGLWCVCVQHHRLYHRCETDERIGERRAPLATFSASADAAWSSPPADRAPWTTCTSPLRPALARRLAGTSPPSCRHWPAVSPGPSRHRTPRPPAPSPDRSRTKPEYELASCRGRG